MTRKDLEIPVTRAIVPGFEMMADFDRDQSHQFAFV